MMLDKLRFVVGKNGQGYSTPWVVLGNNNDIYLGSKNTSGNIKISLHSSGCCHLAVTQPHWEKMQQEGVPGPKERFIMNWARQPTPASGAATAAILWFPTEFLKAPRVRAEKGKTMFHFESAPAGQAAEIRLLYSREPSEAFEPSFAGKARPICHFDFPNGEHLAVVGRYVEFNSVAIDTFPKKTANYVELMKNSLPKPGSALEGLTMALYNDAATDGVLKVIEVGGVRLSADGTTTTGARPGTGS